MENVPFHPLVARWFTDRFGAPTAPQAAGWTRIAAGTDTLIAAPTGSGKTLAAFLWAINGLVGAATAGRLQDRTSIVYVSPLKALGNDIQKNLQEPLSEIQQLAATTGTALAPIRALVRSGDTPAYERQLMLKRPPHILITTPESLYILLTAEGSRRMLAGAHTVIVDEIHAVAGDKRGAHLALSLERLDALVGHRLQRIGLSATQHPIAEIARLLVGDNSPSLPRRGQGGRLKALPHPDPLLGREREPAPHCAIVDIGHQRALDLRIEVTGHELGPIATHELYADIYDRIVAHTRTHRTTIVFVNTRRLVERGAHQLAERLGHERVAAHHGSLSRRTRLQAEEGLRSGAIPVVVATASLELGIDIGHVDLVCHLGSPRALSTLLQRVGRSGHWLGAVPKGILFPLTRDDLVQCAAAIRAVRAGQLDRIGVPQNPLDILAQQIVATIASQKMGEEELWQLVHRAYPFRNLARDDFEAVLEMVCEGMASSRGRRSAHLHRDRVHRRLRPRRGARLAAITGGGAIPDTADYDVIEEPAETYVGKVNEDFAVESMAADIFLLGNRSWRIRRVEAGKIRVADAEGAPPSIPFWLGEAPARTQELSGSVAALREQVAARLDGLHSEQPAPYAAGRDDSAVNWLMADCGVDRAGAEQIIAYVADTRAVLGAVPTQTTIIAERFFDESGGMQLVIHAPFGARINRAWGLALRKRFCRTFDFELQAAATDDGIVLSLGEQHSFPLEGVFTMLRPATVENDLLQAALATPMFSTRWRWNATRALALLRRTGGRRVPMPIQRMRAEDLLAAVFPAQLACGDNHPRGAMEPPDHPLVNETIDNCLHEAMDTDGLRGLIESIEGGAIRTIAVDTPAPSPMSHEILNANPYAFLDDAPLEERRARAVSLRRVEPDLAGGIGALDPAAIRAVRAQAWPDVRDADELHDLLLSLVVLPLPASGGDANHLLTDPPLPDGVLVGEETRQKCLGAPWDSMAIELVRERRATRARWGAYEALVAAERMGVVQAALPDVRFDPPPPALPDRSPVEAETAQRAIVRGWMECVGPVTAGALAAFLGVLETKVEAALLRLESEGIVLRGRFTNTTDSREPIAHDKGPSQFHYQLSPIDHEPSLEWCDRRLLARIHRLTIAGLRREIEAVSAAEFIRFLVRWQHVHPGTQLHGRTGVVQVIKQLQGIELPASAWERKVLPARISLYDTADLDRLCLAGEVAWGRLRLPDAGGGDEEGLSPAPTRRRASPTRVAPLALVMREALPALLEAADVDVTADISPAAREVLAHLQQHGASFLVDIARATGRLITETEEALWELVARGVVTGDGIAGLRTLLLPDVKRRRPRRRLHALHGGLAPRLLPAGRWALLRTVSPVSAASNSANEFFAAQLLRRYGVVFRELLVREVRAPAWRVLRDIYRRMEARGAIRGGRFVAGFVGEQFALPDAVDALRAVRRTSPDVKPVVIAAADPLNLVGILTPGHRVSPFSNQAIAYENGVPIEVGALGAVMSRLRGRTSVATTVSLSKRLSR